MRASLLLVLLTLTQLSLAQFNAKPYSNPNNNLNLKAVYQNYQIVTRVNQYGHTRTEDAEFLLLKVNDQYLKFNDTGINKDAFNGFLSNCPQSLDLALVGLNSYSQSRTNHIFRNIGTYALYIGAATFGLKSLNENNRKKNQFIAAGSLVSGITYSYLMNRRTKKLRQVGHDQIIDAMAMYQSSCFEAPEKTSDSDNKTDLENQNNYTTTSETQNGESNENEKIDIDVISNNVEGSLFTINGNGTSIVLDNVALGYGGHIEWFKKGWYIDAGYNNLVYSIGFSDIPQDNKQFIGNLKIGIPLFKGVKDIDDIVHIGSAYGIQYSGKLKDAKSFQSLSLEGGIQHYQMYSGDDLSFRKEYFVKSTFLRGGLSYNIFIEKKYKINDERFSNAIKHDSRKFYFFANAIYNSQTEFDIFPRPNSLIQYTDPVEKSLGFVGGIGASFNKFILLPFRFELEIGRYPINNDLKGFGGQLNLGFGIHTVK